VRFPTAQPTRFAGVTKRPQSAAGDPMTLGNMRVNGVHSLNERVAYRRHACVESELFGCLHDGGTANTTHQPKYPTAQAATIVRRFDIRNKYSR
jgi:hypothetical protein